MGSGARPAAAPLADREPSELLGLRLPQPAVEPAAGDAVTRAWRCARWPGRWRRRRSAVPPPPAAPASGRAAPTAAQPARTPASRPASPASPSIAGAAPSRAARTTPRPGSAATPSASPAPVNPRDALKRRRANVLFVLALTAASTLFLAATTQVAADDLGVRRLDRRPARLRLPARPAAPARARRAGAGRRSRARPPRRQAPDPPRATVGATARRRLAARSPPAARRTAGRTPSDAGRRSARPIGMGRRPPSRYTRARRGAVAQLVERNNRTVEARGSIPLSSTRRSLALWRVARLRVARSAASERPVDSARSARRHAAIGTGRRRVVVPSEPDRAPVASERGGEALGLAAAQGGVDALALEDLVERLGGLLDRVLGEERLHVGGDASRR